MPGRFILTGAPGAGKTVLLRQLELDGADVVEEAATDIIAHELSLGVHSTWTSAGLAGLAGLQRQREMAPMQGRVRYSDRSVFCTLALARFLEVEAPPELGAEINRVIAADWFDPKVLFVEQLETIANTAVRRIGYDDARRFAAVHVATYREFGFQLLSVPPLSLADRVARVRELTL